MNERDVIREIVAKGSRIDGRGFLDYRKLKITPNVASNAEGSARVELGETKVIAGVKLSVGEPFKDKPDEGVLIVHAEFLPLAYEEFEPGPPKEDAIEVARVVDRVIRESKAIALDKLCVEAGKLVWKVVIDIIVLDNDGNLIDASLLASVAALKHARLPKLIIEGENVEIDREEKVEALPLNRIPTAVTVFKLGDVLLLDPNLKEEQACDARLTIGMFFENGEAKICALQKGGSKNFTYEEFERALEIAETKGKELLEKLQAV